MRISVLALGTRGDTEPFVALGAGLRRAGHDVRLVAFERFGPLAADHGLDFLALPGDPADMFATRAWAELVVTPWNWRGHMRALREMLEPVMARIGPEHGAAVCDGADAVVFSSNTTFGYWAASERGLPSAMATLVPLDPTWAFPHPVLTPGLRLGRLGNRLSYVLAQRLAGDVFREPVRPRSRVRLGFSPVPLRGTSAAWPPFPVVAGLSPTLVPRPPDWPAHVHQTGAWLTAATAEARVPAELDRFLGDGPPPVYVSFGSMRPGEGERLLGAVLGALDRTGQRAVLGSGFGPAAAALARPDVFAAEELPHELVLRRFSAFVHHGGAGTTARGLTAGRPTLVVPFVFDQAFWGRRVAALGAGPPPIPRHRLTAERLARALAALDRPAVRRAAEAVGERMRREDGVGAAVGVLERVLGAERR